MDDDVVDAALLVFEVAQHFLQGGPIRGRAGDAAFDEFFDDHRADALGLLLVRVSLCRDGEPFLSSASLGLLTGGHPQIRHGALGGK
ncbi:hypothetical protein KPL76_09195 [Subtercola sp. PAMC28395]|nr:hypothetical protein [Subtercola sp. PAMC28395]QWT22955.1 hypothetical protein KPL76_09195 [Subtercola sp. PAMC28395]